MGHSGLKARAPGIAFSLACIFSGDFVRWKKSLAKNLWKGKSQGSLQSSCHYCLLCGHKGDKCNSSFSWSHLASVCSCFPPLARSGTQRSLVWLFSGRRRSQAALWGAPGSQRWNWKVITRCAPQLVESKSRHKGQTEALLCWHLVAVVYFLQV